jgi:repressor of RNA polymerase III transcription MAF1
MRFLEIQELDQVSSRLTAAKGAGSLVTTIEAYLCKAGSDKRLYKSLDNTIAERAKSPDVRSTLSVSPFGSMSDSAARKAFIFLIATLNASFVDYDFSGVHVDEFRAERNCYVCVNEINTMLEGVVDNYALIRDKLWSTIDRNINIKECELYEFTPDPDDDPFRESGAAWHLSWFFYNRKMGRVLFWHSRFLSKSSQAAASVSGSGGASSGGGGGGASNVGLSRSFSSFGRQSAPASSSAASSSGSYGMSAAAFTASAARCDDDDGDSYDSFGDDYYDDDGADSLCNSDDDIGEFYDNADDDDSQVNDDSGFFRFEM